MTTTETIEFLKKNDITRDAFYNTLTADIWSATQISPDDMADPKCQRLIQFFMYQLEAVAQPVISQLRQRIAELESKLTELKDCGRITIDAGEKMIHTLSEEKKDLTRALLDCISAARSYRSDLLKLSCNTDSTDSSIKACGLTPDDSHVDVERDKKLRAARALVDCEG